MGRRGPSPDHAKREAFARLIAEGVPSARACRMVGINPRTGKRWRNGRRLASGGRVLNLAPVITVTSVPVKQYSARYLSEDERVRLADLRREGHTMREIAALMGRSPSTVSRELARGADASGRYGPFEAHRRALGRRRLRRPSRLARDAELRDWVSGTLQARWSPEQVARRLRHEFPGQPERWLCAETIYQAVYRPDLGGLPRELPGRVLRLRRRHRLARRHARARRAGPVTGMTLIHERPAEALGREQPGHWKGDLIVGAGNASAIVTMVERTTRFTLLGHLEGTRHDSATVRDTVVAALAGLPPHLRRTLTWGPGHPYGPPWRDRRGPRHDGHLFPPGQRPTNENTNGLLRAYFPKSTDLSVHTDADVALVQAELNQRPRKVAAGTAPPTAWLHSSDHCPCCDVDCNPPDHGGAKWGCHSQTDESALLGFSPTGNGETGVDNPERQGLNSTILDALAPINTFPLDPDNDNQEDNNYSPMWDAHINVWTPAAIEAGGATADNEL